ncbi:MAG: 6-phosphofructokinase [Lachnospiraceae bacterium]|nr:6-phosphofructokinase [Lachnospiraceae bacterium]
MAKTIEQIGVLTSGGDAPGMNAAVRAVVRRALSRGLEVKGIQRGYHGLLNEMIFPMDHHSVSEIMQRGGTILQTARSGRMKTEEGVKMAAEMCGKHGLDALVVIGGDGSYRGAMDLSKLGVNVVGIPGTIDLDIGSTEYTIGFDTAVNTAMDAIDKIRDSSTAHERCSIIEVMGRTSGYIALWAGMACGAEKILLPENYDHDLKRIIDEIRTERNAGKKHYIIVNAEGIGESIGMAEKIEEATGMETRATILGYLQRGGNPTCRDRVYASMMGAKAVDILLEGKKNRVVSYMNGRFTDFDIAEASEMKKDWLSEMYDIAQEIH